MCIIPGLIQSPSESRFENSAQGFILLARLSVGLRDFLIHCSNFFLKQTVSNRLGFLNKFGQSKPTFMGEVVIGISGYWYKRLLV